MHIEKTFEVRRVHTTRGTENNHAALILTLACRLDRIDPYDRGILMGYQDEEIRVLLRAEDRVDPAEDRPMEKLWSANGDGEERMRPGPAETCQNCGKVIGDDPDARFYTPLAGPPSPFCGACAQEIEDEQVAAEAEEERVAEEAGAAIDRAIEQDLAPDEPEDVPIGDGPMPERPADAEPVTTPTRRRR